MSLYNWADNVAERIIREKGNKAKYTLASGITPSGTVHIGNFREIITVELIVRALLSRGKKVRFIYSWDDYDVFRKVPTNMPKQRMLKKYLRKAVADIPDPFETENSYAHHHEVDVELDIARVGINPEYIYQVNKYKNCDYSNNIIISLQNADRIRKILNEYRKEPLTENWFPVSGFCPKCGLDKVKFSNYNGKYYINMECLVCKEEIKADIRKSPFLKLPWRIDWPMRWAYEKVDFEPGGKDHSTVGGSFTTAKEIIKIYNWTAPTYQMYDFIRIKGMGGKISSSKGNVITLRDCLEIYEPEVVRYLFAGTRPNAEFAISFDLDVIKIYEDFDKCERIHYKKQATKNKKEFEKQKRIYELSVVNKVNKKMSFQPSFRHLTTIVQVYEGDSKRVVDHYKKVHSLKTKQDINRLIARSICAYNWVSKYAPNDMKFKIQKKVKAKLTEKEKKALKLVSQNLKKSNFSEVELKEHFYNICQNINLEPKQFFKVAYKVLINKESGPKLASFLLILGDRAINLFSKV